MVRENAATKARRYLVEGRVIVTHVSDGTVTARIRGDGTVWNAGYDGGVWFCDCPGRSDQCSHLKAVRLVTSPEVTS